jgi:phosphate starvation-inducible PhoH-like protein
LTARQKEFLALAADKSTKIIFVSGPAGTAKTFLSIFHALTMINEKRVSDLIYIRSAVECSERSIGLLPGTLDEKIGVYLQPLVDKLEELLPKNDIELLKKEERITGMPLSFLRGLNWNAKVIIADEAQNMTYKEILTLITRVGEFSKVFVIGDSGQSDINGKSGFLKMMGNFDDDESRKNGIFTFKFGTDDIVRSGIVRFIIEKLNRII